MKKKDFYQVSLKLILKNEKGEVLILRDAGKNEFAGFYDLPGGTIDTSELKVQIQDILKREIIEETGNIEVKVNEIPVALGRHEFAKLDALGNKIKVFYIFFEGQYFGGEVVVSEEHFDYKWVDLEDIELEKYFISGMLDGIQMYLKNDR